MIASFTEVDAEIHSKSEACVSIPDRLLTAGDREEGPYRRLCMRNGLMGAPSGLRSGSVAMLQIASLQAVS